MNQQKTLHVFILFLIIKTSLAQISIDKSIFFANTFSKEIALYHGKSFLVNQVLKKNENPTLFEIFPLVASNSGELTTLIYKCKDQNQTGMIFGFWNENVLYSGLRTSAYSYLNFNKEDSIILLE
jgi:hypothetical protein